MEPVLPRIWLDDKDEEKIQMNTAIRARLHLCGLTLLCFSACSHEWPAASQDFDDSGMDAGVSDSGSFDDSGFDGDDTESDADVWIPTDTDGSPYDVGDGDVDNAPIGDADVEDDEIESPDADVPDDDPPESDCLPVEDYDFTKTGRFAVKRSSIGAVNVYVPQDLPAGCKVPVVHFSNGTGAYCRFYDSVLSHLASYGFISSCYESTQTGSGEACMNALDVLYENYPAIAAHKIGSTGHSQGGGAAITCTYLAEQRWGETAVVAAHAIQPAHGMNRSSYRAEYPLIESPVFIMSGSRDYLVSDSWIESGFDMLEAEAYWYRALGASHFNPHDWASPSAVAWFRWKLLDDERAGEYFLDLPTSDYWEAVRPR